MDEASRFNQELIKDFVNNEGVFAEFATEKPKFQQHRVVTEVSESTWMKNMLALAGQTGHPLLEEA